MFVRVQSASNEPLADRTRPELEAPRPSSSTVPGLAGMLQTSRKAAMAGGLSPTAWRTKGRRGGAGGALRVLDRPGPGDVQVGPEGGHDVLGEEAEAVEDQLLGDDLAVVDQEHDPVDARRLPLPDGADDIVRVADGETVLD